MNLAINLPTWAVDFWTVYGSQITPVLVTLMLALLTWLAIKVRSDAKLNAAKTETQIDFMKQLAEKEDCKPEVNKQTEEINDLKRIVTFQSEMINLAFQNSNLDPEIKNNLDILNNKILYGSEDNYVKDLESENAKLQEEIENLKQKLIPQEIVKPVETKTRVRR